jgi:hypothetical protein
MLRIGKSLNELVMGYFGSLTGPTGHGTPGFGFVSYFDGTDDYGMVPHNTQFTLGSNFTYSIWVCPHSVDSNRQIVTKGPDGAEQFEFIIGDSVLYCTVTFTTAGRIYIYSAGPPDVNKWTLLTGTYDGTTFRLYFNGVEQANTTVSGDSMVEQSNDIYFGAEDTGNARYYHGLMTDFRLYRRCFSPQEIWALYNPATRWDLYRQPRKLWINSTAAPATALFNAGWAKYPQVVGVGVI